MRKRDLHILTSNIYTYTGDQRFSVIHAPDSEDWDLKIEYPQKKDEGIYECQVNTEPKINLAVLLHVTGTKCLDLVFCTHNHRIVRWLALSPFDVTHGTVVELQDNVSDQTNSVLFGAPTTRRRNVQFDSQREPNNHSNAISIPTCSFHMCSQVHYITIGKARTLMGRWHRIRYGIKLLHFELFQFAFLSSPAASN